MSGVWPPLPGAPAALLARRAPVQLVVMAKAPQPGLAKTRLAPALGLQGAALLARHMLAHALQQARASAAGPVELCMSPPPDDPAWAGVDRDGVDTCTDQGPGDLGRRMARIVARHAPMRPVLILGTDCPALDQGIIAAAAAALADHDAALVPVRDGGYVLIGLRAPCEPVFSDMPWSTPAVFAETVRRLGQQGRSVWTGPMLSDVDEPADLENVPSGWI